MIHVVRKVLSSYTGKEIDDDREAKRERPTDSETE